MNPKPRDFRDAQAFKKGRSLGAISETIRAGVMDQGVGMPGYPHLPDAERRAIGAYVASLHESD
jgi:mono/diheme cytochrome c family protein